MAPLIFIDLVRVRIDLTHLFTGAKSITFGLELFHSLQKSLGTFLGRKIHDEGDKFVAENEIGTYVLVSCTVGNIGNFWLMTFLFFSNSTFCSFGLHIHLDGSR